MHVVAQPDLFGGDQQSSRVSRTSSAATGDDGQGDPLFHDACQAVMQTGRASISSIQRHLRIGYNRAARLIEGMEQIGIVSPMDSSGSRTVLLAS